MPNLKKESGQSLVEFALVLPILLLLVFSIIDFGMLFAAKNQLEMSTFAAARTISLGNPTPQGVTVNFPNGDTVGNGNSVTVTATTNYTAITPIMKIILGSNVVPLKSQTSMVIEQPQSS